MVFLYNDQLVVCDECVIDCQLGRWNESAGRTIKGFWKGEGKERLTCTSTPVRQGSFRGVWVVMLAMLAMSAMSVKYQCLCRSTITSSKPFSACISAEYAEADHRCLGGLRSGRTPGS
jgi:hypothetical protein